MGNRLLSVLSAFILSLAAAFAEAPAVDPEARAVAPEAQADQGTGLALETAPPDIRSVSGAGAYRQHAPLAFFSLGSLVVGGVFYGIHASLDYPGGQAAGDGTRVGMAMGAAGLSALAAGASYLYYARRGGRKGPTWAGNLSGGVAPDGSMAASVTMPLSSFTD